MVRTASIVLATILCFVPWLTSLAQTDRFLLFGEGLVSNSVEDPVAFDAMNLDSTGNYLRLNMGMQNIRCWMNFDTAAIRESLSNAYRSFNNIRVMVHDPAYWELNEYMGHMNISQRTG
jgi:hypothetical protein